MIDEVFTGYGSKEIMEREEAFDKQALEIFSHYTIHDQIELICPQVLVRVLPKDMFIGSIYIPDVASSNKPIYEGIVIRTWMPRRVPTKYGSREISSELSPGDHVLFPHFAGQPLPGLNENKYRVVPEAVNRDTGAFQFGNDVGLIFSKVNYKIPSVEENLNDIMLNRMGMTYSSVDQRDLKLILKYLMEDFDIAVKVKGSVTKTGV